MDRNSGRSRLVPISAVLGRGALTLDGRSVGPDHERTARRSRGPLVLGHRGFPGPQPRENSVQAVEAALTHGADGAEVDVRLTADGMLLCSHSEAVRTEAGNPVVLSASTAAEVQRAVWQTDARLATLQELLEAVRQHGPCRLVVEAKPVASTAAVRRTAQALKAALHTAVGDVEIVVSSFDSALIGAFRGAVSGGVRTALLGDVGAPAHSVLRGALDAGHEEVHLNVADLRRTPQVVGMARRLGVAVTAWTANGTEDLRWLAELDVDAVITDDVITARATMSGLPRGAVNPAVAGISGLSARPRPVNTFRAGLAARS
jgi:glycerophosphoryl diester phosphodiesterase